MNGFEIGVRLFAGLLLILANGFFVAIEFHVRRYRRSPDDIPKSTFTSEVVDRFQEEHQELALVFEETEEYMLGLVTATDALEAVMGESRIPWMSNCGSDSTDR